MKNCQMCKSIIVQWQTSLQEQPFLLFGPYLHIILIQGLELCQHLNLWLLYLYLFITLKDQESASKFSSESGSLLMNHSFWIYGYPLHTRSLLLKMILHLAFVLHVLEVSSVCDNFNPSAIHFRHVMVHSKSGFLQKTLRSGQVEHRRQSCRLHFITAHE